VASDRLVYLIRSTDTPYATQRQERQRDKRDRETRETERQERQRDKRDRDRETETESAAERETAYHIDRRAYELRLSEPPLASLLPPRASSSRAWLYNPVSNSLIH
jgi:hypothetical protein